MYHINSYGHLSFSLSLFRRRGGVARVKQREKKRNAIPSHTGRAVDTVAHTRVAIRHFFGLPDSERQRDMRTER